MCRLRIEILVERLQEPGAECVLALPTRDQLRQITICSMRLPAGVSAAQIARFHMCKSLSIEPNSIDDCPVNFECLVTHVERYHTHLIAFLRVIGASIDPDVLFWDREDIVKTYPTNLADHVVDEKGMYRIRVSMLNDLYACPAFPVGPKGGWYGTFVTWMQDLCEESLISEAELQQIVEWHDMWDELFPLLDDPARADLRKRLTQISRLCARERWDELHNYLQRSLEE